MKRFLLSFALVLFYATAAHAQYGTSPEVVKNSGEAVSFKFSGSGLPDKVLVYSVPVGLTGPQTIQNLREWIGTQVARLNAQSTVANVAALQVGQVVPGLPAPGPVTPPAQTAAQVWAQRANQLIAMNNFRVALTANGGTPNAAFTTDLQTLVTQTTVYVAGAFSQF